MDQNIVVEVKERSPEEKGKNAARRIRKVGGVPAIVYGLGLPPFPVAVNAKRIEEVLRLESGRNTIFTLALAGQDKSRAVMMRDMQRDPVSERLLHVDFVGDMRKYQCARDEKRCLCRGITPVYRGKCPALGGVCR